MRPMTIFARTCLSTALLCAAVPTHADVKSGVDAWETGQYQTAVATWRPLAIAGDPDAQFNLGQAYKLGRGVPADLVQAEIWFRRAADQGHLQAEDNLGLVLFTAGQRAAAMRYIIRAAARGEPRAQYVLGTAHFNGDLADRDMALAYALTKRASDAGLAVASARLAQLDQLISLDERQRGLALLPDLEKSEQRTRLAAATDAMPQPSQPAASRALPAAGRVMPGTRYAVPPIVAAVPKSAPVPAADNWRAQLGAFSTEARARALWAALTKQHPAVRAAKPHLVKAAAITRLQAGNFTARSDAEAFCSKVKSASQPCVVLAK